MVDGIERVSRQGFGQLTDTDIMQMIPGCFSIEPSYEVTDEFYLSDKPPVACLSLICNGGDEPQTIALVSVPEATTLRTLILRAHEHWMAYHGHQH